MRAKWSMLFGPEGSIILWPKGSILFGQRGQICLAFPTSRGLRENNVFPGQLVSIPILFPFLEYTYLNPESICYGNIFEYIC